MAKTKKSPKAASTKRAATSKLDKPSTPKAARPKSGKNSQRKAPARTARTTPAKTPAEKTATRSKPDKAAAEELREPTRGKGSDLEAIIAKLGKCVAEIKASEDRVGMPAKEIRRTLREMKASLFPPGEEKVLRYRYRFGVGEKSDPTLKEVGQDFEVTRERIRQIEAKARRKQRHPSRSKRLSTGPQKR